MVNGLTAGTGSSRVVDRCQICDSTDLEPVLFVGFLPPVNTMPPVGARPTEQPSYPAQLLRCANCTLVQMGLVVDPHILFPRDYAYTSGTTKILRENFAEMAAEIASTYPLPPDSLVVDVGSNDGTLLGNFVERGYRVLGLEPTDKGDLARAKGIDTIKTFFTMSSAKAAVERAGLASLVTATNVFAHIEDVHSVVDAICALLRDDGIFISESHYLASLVETVQYDTVYHEHLRYYSLATLARLLSMHGLEVIRAKRIPTHGGSIRVYAARKGKHPVDESVQRLLKVEEPNLTLGALAEFRRKVTMSKLGLHSLLSDLVREKAKIYAVGAPSRAATLINYVGLDDGMLRGVLEVDGSHKVGRYMPGTLIPVVKEDDATVRSADYLVLLSWHIADELMPKLRKRGFAGTFVVPLPEPRFVRD